MLLQRRYTRREESRGAGEAMAVVQQRWAPEYRQKVKKTHEMHSGRPERQSAKP
jgi:hypothetical protein